MSKESALQTLLSELFTAAELRAWLRFGAPKRRSLVDDLPGESAPTEQLTHELVLALLRHGLVDTSLFEDLLALRPRRADDIRPVAAQWALALAAAPPQARGGSGPLDHMSRAEQVAALEELLMARQRHLHDGRIPVDMGERIDALIHRIMQGGRPKAGDTVAGARLRKPVGAGNFGTIWLAEGPGGAELAVKVFHLEKLGEGVMLWRFRRSIRAMRQLTADRRAPPTIARRGWTLDAKLERFLEVCRAVEFAHKVGIIHRDIKPANVVLDAEGRPVLTDFDISDIKFATRLSTAGGLGTPIFAAPEQLEQGDQADERSDIYSLGRLLHFLLLERSPGYQDERDPTLANLSAFPEALVAVVRRACQWDPRRRYPDVGALVRDVEECQSGWAAARAYARRGVRWARYNWSLLLIAGLVSGGSLGGCLPQRRIAEKEQENARKEREYAERLDALIASMKEIQESIEAREASMKGLSAKAEELRAWLARKETELALLSADSPERAAVEREIAPERARLQDVEAALDAGAKALAEDRQRLERKQREAEQTRALVQAEEVAPTQDPEPPAEEPPPATGCDLRPTGGPTGGRYVVQEGGSAPMTFVGLSAGRFCMGSPDGEGEDYEHPQHAVRVSGFLLSQSEVTQAQWSAVVRAAAAAGDAEAAGLEEDPSRYKGGARPVESVSWCEAARFANALSRLQGLAPAYTVGSDCEAGGEVGWDKGASGFRLPTEAEWEYAARAGTETAYSFGEDPTQLCTYANVADRTAKKSHPDWSRPFADCDDGYAETALVCSFARNPWGLCDVRGNVWEWTWDWYEKYPSAEVGNPAGPSRGDFRVLRGGSWFDTPDNARSANRNDWLLSFTSGFIGFRLVLPAVPSEPVEGGS